MSFDADANGELLWPLPGIIGRREPPPGSCLMTDTEDRSDRVKLVYNAQRDAPAGIVLDYLLNHPHFTSRQGRQQAIDAISAFYRPLAEEHRGMMSQAELQEVVRNSVEVLAKQMEALCSRYQIESPRTAHSGAGASDGLGRLEAVLADGLAIALALRSGTFLPAGISGEIPHATLLPSTLQFGQGVTMAGASELGLLLEDDDSFTDLAA